MEGNKRVRRRRRNTVERLKNLLILLLTLSAVVLTVRVLMFNGLVDKGPRGWLDHLLSLLNPGQSVPADAPEATGQAGAAAQPVRIAVCDDSLKELEVISEYSFVKEDLLCVKAYFYFFGIIIK